MSKLDTTRWTAGWVVAVAACIAATGPAVGGTRPVVAVQPKIVHLKQDASVTVSGIAASSLEVRLIGASRAKGALLPWAKLVRAHSSWRGRLPQPALRGVYPIELRGGPEASVWRSRYWLLRVLAPGTLDRPSFRTPEAVARWWVRTAPAKARLVALRRWPRPAFDHRDPRLHQLLVVAYTVDGHRRTRDRLGMFVTAFRNGYSGRWRLLEATVLP